MDFDFNVCKKCGEVLKINEGYLINGKWFCDTCGGKKHDETKETIPNQSDNIDNSNSTK